MRAGSSTRPKSTTRAEVAPFYIEQRVDGCIWPSDSNVVHLLDLDNILDRNSKCTAFGVALCGATALEDENGFAGSDAEITTGHPVCPECAKVALELRQQSICVESSFFGDPLTWNEATSRWEIG